MSNPIALAVSPFKSDAIRRAATVAKATIEQVAADLTANENRLDKTCPPPPTKQGKAAYVQAQTKRDLYYRLAEVVSTDNRPGGLRVGLMTQVKADKFIAMAQEDAAFEYDAFVAKLQKKVGECESAELEGNHVWGRSTLTVKFADGRTEFWITSQIINISKLGKLFNQWPSRKSKSSK